MKKIYFNFLNQEFYVSFNKTNIIPIPLSISVKVITISEKMPEDFNAINVSEERENGSNVLNVIVNS